MPAENDHSDSSLKVRLNIAGNRARLLAYRQELREKYALDAALKAGRGARDAAIVIEECCTEVEATNERERNREQLGTALQASLSAVEALAAAQPITDLDGWLTASLAQDAPNGINPRYGVAQSGAVR